MPPFNPQTSTAAEPLLSTAAKEVLGVALALATVIGGVIFFYARALTPNVGHARAFYASQPIYLRPFPYTAVPQGVADLRAATCGVCHQQIYREWRLSTHARAWLDDVQFQEELKKSKKAKTDVAWMCVNCHTPLESQLERLVIGLQDGRVERPITIDNPAFDAELQLDAITCAVCHVKNGVIYGPYGDSKAPHPVRKDPDLLSHKICIRCHQAKASFPKIALACVFDTGKEFESSRYAKRGDRCQTCHMPEIRRPLMRGFSPRKTRRHWFGGSLIPKKPEFERELAPLRKIFPDGMAVAWIDRPTTLIRGESRELHFSVKNAHAGHLLPTGDPERFIWVKAQVLDERGAIVAERKERFGTVYQWYPKVKKISDSRLKPDERRRYAFTVSPKTAGRYALRLIAAKYRLSRKNLRYHNLQGRTVAGRVFFDRRWPLSVIQR